MAYKDRSRPKGPRAASKVTAPKVKDLAKSAKKSKRQSREDVNQAAARNLRELTKGK
jgi:hypothetical protein